MTDACSAEAASERQASVRTSSVSTWSTFSALELCGLTTSRSSYPRKLRSHRRRCATCDEASRAARLLPAASRRLATLQAHAKCVDTAPDVKTAYEQERKQDAWTSRPAWSPADPPHLLMEVVA